MFKNRIVPLLLIIALCCSCQAGAAGLERYSEACQARFAAREAVKSKYGLTDSTMCYFTEALQKTDTGYTAYYYTSFPDMDFVLGRYEVTVTDGIADAKWTWDGADLSGGLASDAWGSSQLNDIWQYNQKTADMQGYYVMAERLAGHADNATSESYLTAVPEETVLDIYADTEGEVKKGTVGRSDAVRIAMDAVIEHYALNDELTKQLSYDDEFIFTSANSDGEEIMTVTLLLWKEYDWEPKCGTYFASVNLVTGLVENITYNDGVIGNG